MTQIIELSTTLESEQQALELADALVQDRLAACVQISGPIRSVYRWQGQVHHSVEYRCTVKSTQGLADRLLDAVTRRHPYDTPELLITEVSQASPAYAAWLLEQLD